jgi:hypothetical protein
MGIFLGTASVLVLDGTTLPHSQQHFSQLHVRVVDNNGNKPQPPLNRSSRHKGSLERTALPDPVGGSSPLCEMPSPAFISTN